MPSSAPPNILLIVLDTTRRDRLSIYGAADGPLERETSPRFDTFAATSALFERAVSPAQWTIPAHASLFTGLYPSTHQLTQANRRLSGSYPTLVETLQAGGYTTVGFCNNPLVGIVDNGLARGFDAFYNYAGAAPNRPHHAHRPALRRALARRWQHFAVRTGNHFAQSDWLFRASMNPRLVPIWTRFIHYKGHTARSIDDLIAYLGAYRAGGQAQPLFTFLNLMGAHLPYRPPREVLAQVAPQIARDRAARRFIRRFNAEASRWASPADPPLSAWERAVLDAYYRAEIAAQDAHLGRLFDGLRAMGALDDTLVIVAADHGEGHGDHLDMVGHSFVVNHELVHVPLAIHYPDGRAAGRRVSANVSTRRVFHTVLEAAGIDAPLDAADPNANTHGLSLARFLNGSHPHSDPDAGRAYSEAFPPATLLSLLERRSPHLIERLHLRDTRRGVYAGDYKLALVGQSVEGLYDLAADPTETRDIAAEHAQQADALRDDITAMVAHAERFRADGAAFAEVDDTVKSHLRALGYIE